MLNMDQVKQLAPSVFASEPWDQVSKNYRFVPTIDVVNAMLEKGFAPVSAAQSRTRIEGKREFTRHVLRFRHQDMQARKNVGDSIPEIVLMNSHDRSSAYKIMLGMFRLVCSNGMVVCSGMVDEITARHSGRKDIVQEVIDGSFRIIEHAPKAVNQIEQWQNIRLKEFQAEAFATAALELRDSAIKPEPYKMLVANRESDKGNDLWRTFNRVQENMVRGGISAVNANNQRRTTRGINSVNEDVKFNRALWRLTEELAKKAA